jgi:hypothetical protein
MAIVLLVSAAVLGCQASPPPSPSPTARRSGGSAIPSQTASPTPGPSVAALPTLFPLPSDFVASGTIAIAPKTAHTAEVGTAYPYELQHCGLFSPIDFDGTVWDIVGAQNGKGGQATEDQLNSLVNALSGTMTLLGPDTAVFKAKSGVIVGLKRHTGPKRYMGCA